MSEEAAPEEKIDKKDVTPDFLIDDLTSDKEEDRTGTTGASPKEEKGDHPAITILDMAVKQSGEFLKSQGLPPANNAVYENFSKPFLNTALWHYLPDGSIPDDPRVALALGIGGLALAFAPTVIALHHRKEEEEEEKKEKEKAKKKRETEEKDEQTFHNVVTGEKIEEKKDETPVPDWMTRLEENTGGLPGM